MSDTKERWVTDAPERWMVDYEHGEGEPQHAVLSWTSDDPTKALPEVGEVLVRLSDYERIERELAACQRENASMAGQLEIALHNEGIANRQVESLAASVRQLEAERDALRKWPDDLEAGFLHAIEVAKAHGAPERTISGMLHEWNNDPPTDHEIECFHCARMRPFTVGAVPEGCVVVQEKEREAYRAELLNIANARRFDRKAFRDDTEFADWAQSRARSAAAKEGKK